MLTRILASSAAVICICLSVNIPSASAGDNGVCLATGSGAEGAGWYACAGTPGVNRLPTPLGAGASRTGETTGQTTAAVKGSSADPFCTYNSADTVDGTAPPAPRVGAGRWVFVYCGDSGQPGGWTWVVGAVGAPVVFASPAQLAQQAYAQLTPHVGLPDYNPRRGAGGADGTVVGFPTWLWLDGSALATRSVTAAAGPNSATVTARPVSVSFDPGDGSPPVVCPGGGVAYNPAQPDATSDCVHRYLRASVTAPGGVFELTARVVWSATWAGTGGTGGVLPALTVTSTTPVRVEELQAVNEQ